MKNFFTSVMAALFMAAPVGNLSAQTSQQLTKSQEEAIKKELLPVVFEQIKEQAGIDILGWATPKLNANTLSGIPVLESSNLLRAGTAQEDISVKPDSIILFMDKLGKVKLEFENYSDKKFPSVVGDRALDQKILLFDWEWLKLQNFHLNQKEKYYHLSCKQIFHYFNSLQKICSLSL